MSLPTPPMGLEVTQGLDGIQLEMVTYRPSRLGQLISAVILLGALGITLVFIQPAAMVLGIIVAALVYLLAGTLTGPSLKIRITDRVLQETVSGRTRSWPLEELRDIESERWSMLERRMGQVRFSTASSNETIGGGNRLEEVRWLGRVLTLLAERRRELLAVEQPNSPLTVRPPSEILEMLKR
ncbi:MAG: hypothetical protein ACI8RZ_006188 [Myxococcota bacterium]|jgi:hypothetical protein